MVPVLVARLATFADNMGLYSFMLKKGGYNKSGYSQAMHKINR
jgi:hypothetical protein